MATTRKPRLQRDALYTAILSFHGAGGAFVEAGSQWRGDSGVVKLHPQFFALSGDGQPGIDAASAALRSDIDAAAENRKRMWYGTPQEAPPQPARVVAVRRFTHGLVVVEPGSIWDARHPTVQSAPDGFVAVED